MGKHTARSRRRIGTPAKLVATAGTVAVAAAAVSAGVYASWNTSGALTTGTYSAASVSSSFASSGTPVFTAAVSNMVPGDVATRYADLENTSSVSLAFSLATSGSGALAPGLTLVVHSCATAYDEDGLCDGDDDGTVVTSGTSVTQNNRSLGTVAAAGHVYLKVAITLPANADQATYAGTSGTVTLTETGATLAGAAR
jgi:hypothetical protein